MNHLKIFVWLVVACAYVASCRESTIAAQLELSYRSVIVTGDAAPGTADGAYFEYLGMPVINRLGQVAFAGHLAGTTVDHTNQTGIWSEGTGLLSMVVREGELAPGTGPGVRHRNFMWMVLNDNGRISFAGDLNGTGVTNNNFQGLWSDANGTMQLLARTGNLATDAGDGMTYRT